jgi:hypothetical protein
MKLSACSSTIQGGGKRRMGVMIRHFRFAPKATLSHPEAARR